MDRKEIIESQLMSSDGDGENCFKRGQFRLPYEGVNKEGSHDDFIDIVIHEIYGDQNVNSSNFHEPLLKYLCKPQFAADVFPFSKTEPDTVYKLNEYEPDNSSCSIFVWDQKASELEIDLKPVYQIEKLIFVFSTYTEIVSFHEAHLLCKTIPL